MKKCFILIICFTFCALEAFGADELKTEKDKISYSLGYDSAARLNSQDAGLDYDAYLKGFKDGLDGKTGLLDENARKEAIMAHRKHMMEQMKAKREIDLKKNAEEGQKFLEENKKKPGVVTLDSGLQYKIITEGNGPKPTLQDKVTTHYRGRLIDGTEFDSSYSRGQPATFPVQGVIKGWTEALQLMPTGSKWELYIPANLAYGERGAGAKIGPNAALIFEIELLDIVKE